jgi:hypothetical protein
MRKNWVALLSAGLFFVSLLLPWLSVSFYTLTGAFPNFQQDFSNQISVSLYFWGFTGAANGVNQTQILPYWFNWATTAMILAAGVLAIKGGLASGKTAKRLLILSGVIALACSPIFYLGLGATIVQTPIPQEKAIAGLFSPASFGLTPEDVSGLHSQYALSFYWLPVLAGILAIMSSKLAANRTTWLDAGVPPNL